uniref:hypothetical protein n=1 Tax=Mesorhizobium sp. WSM4906 TaxID=3038546 RepID=UPI002417DC0B|nr:hypothetical protein [Mesorhizobium sp. WSM4906]WFP74489.1 hypothetical protein QAZ22_22455 [Mesorhizobium sp. WSM4906]
MVDKNAIEQFMTGADETPAPELPISPLVGEMSGRTEGGAVPPASPTDAETVEAEIDEADCRVHRLRTPLRRSGERIDRIRLCPVGLGDIDDWSAGTLSNRDLLVRMAGVSAATLKALRWDDAEAVMSLFQQMVPEFVLAAPKDDA